MNLVVVESPTKAKTIEKFLDSNYQVVSSYGHIRDLPKSKLGINVEKNFEPVYVIPPKARKRVNELKKKAAKADEIILATDEDREGEAIAWHLVQVLGLEDSKTQRIVFHEITEKAIQEALKNPRHINLSLVNAQQARRVLDRLVGYLLSPFLWQKVIRGLSAGRVQSVALRLVVERENEIRNFKPEEYWTIAALLANKTGEQLMAVLTAMNHQSLPKPGLKTKKETEKIINSLKKSIFQISKIEKKETRKNPLPPFITSTLQQEAFKRLRFSAKQTMMLAQHLYEKGFITYMRTDSFNLSLESLTAARRWIEKNLSQEYVLAEPRFFKKKSQLAQEAHEAIRPTQPNLTAEILATKQKMEKNEIRLYELIWRRFIASQLPPALIASTRVEIEAINKKNNEQFLLTVNGNSLLFDGFLKIWPIPLEEKILPSVEEGEILNLIEVKHSQHFTEPPPRYNEASLIKTLEKYGIGRPSTYAPIISLIQTRNYVQKDEKRRFYPTELGELVNKVLTEHFPDIVDIDFTAKMESELDEIAENKKNWHKVIKAFYDPFIENLEKKYAAVTKLEFAKEEKTSEKCEKCGRVMIIKTSRFGKFLACSGFPECKNAKPLHNQTAPNESLGLCPKCLQGQIVIKRTKKRKIFYGCSRYPDCDFASWKKPGGIEKPV